MFSLSAMLALKIDTEFFLNFTCTWLKSATQQQLLHFQGFFYPFPASGNVIAFEESFTFLIILLNIA